jgi:hypothetical protein
MVTKNTKTFVRLLLIPKPLHWISFGRTHRSEADKFHHSYGSESTGLDEASFLGL